MIYIYFYFWYFLLKNFSWSAIGLGDFHYYNWKISNKVLCSLLLLLLLSMALGTFYCSAGCWVKRQTLTLLSSVLKIA